MLSYGTTLIMSSMLVFCVLNLIENMIHYSIGRSYDENNKFVFSFPTSQDFISIIIVMIIFGLAQGILTKLIMKD